MSTSESTISTTTVSPSGIRLVISWEVPTDLDNHVLIYDAFGYEICHLYYGNRDCFGSNLDFDSTAVCGKMFRVFQIVICSSLGSWA